jgi:hypothetical protein
MRLGQLFAIALYALLTSGCAEMTHFNRARDIRDHSAIFIDAKQRGIFTVNQVTCAEPSPDALSALSASEGLSGSSGGTTVAQSLAISEAAGSIGLRTQSIQLMRDHMYRLCEAYQSGAISAITFEVLHRRFQTTMLGILAVEQLTGALRAPAIVLGGSAAQGNAQAIAQLTALRETQTTQLAAARHDVDVAQAADQTARQDVTTKQAAFDAATDAAAKASAQTALTAAQATAQQKAADLLAAQGVVSGRQAALAATDRAMVLAQATGSATSIGTIESQTRTAVDMAAVAAAVQNIVDHTMNLSNSPDLCAMILAETIYIDDPNSSRRRVNLAAPIVTQCLEEFRQNRVTRAM